MEEPTPAPRKPRTKRPKSASTVIVNMPPLFAGVNEMHGLLDRTIGMMEASTRIRESLAFAYWPRVVGDTAAAASEVEMVSNGVLIVRTRSSAWSHELLMHRVRILERLNKLIGAPVIKDIRFHAQGVVKPKVDAATPTPTPAELLKLILEPAEQEELNARLADLVVTIPNPDLRTRISTRVTNEFRLRHWHVAHGWTVCPHCLRAHNSGDELCEFCRLMG